MSGEKRFSAGNATVVAVVLLFGLAALQGFAADKFKIMTYAGNGDHGYSGDGGPATQAALWLKWTVLEDMCFDSNDNLLVVMDGRIRKIDSSGVISTIAGNGGGSSRIAPWDWEYSGEGGQAIEAVIGSPTGLCLDGAGNMYLASYEKDLFWKIDAAGIITTIGGEGKKITVDPSSLLVPRALKIRYDKAGNLYLFQYKGCRMIDKVGAVKESSVPFSMHDACFDKSGNLLVCAANENQVFRIDTTGKTPPVVVAGSGQTYLSETDPLWYSGDGGPALKASLKFPCSIAADSAGNLYIADSGNKVIRKVNAAGIITTIAGGGYFTARSSEGGPATAISLFQPTAIRINSKGDIFFCDPGPGEANPRIFKLYR
jgi:hypothetical protein